MHWNCIKITMNNPSIQRLKMQMSSHTPWGIGQCLSLGNATSSLVPRNRRRPKPKRERSCPSAVGRFLSEAIEATLDDSFIIFATVNIRKLF